MHGAAPTRARDSDDRHHRIRLTTAIGVVVGIAILGAFVMGSGGDADQALRTRADAGSGNGDAAESLVDDLPDLALDDQAELSAALAPTPQGSADDAGCTTGMSALRLDASGDDVRCLQQALVSAGFLSAPTTGRFDDATLGAVMAFQRENGLFVDGVAGRETALALDIWPDEGALVVRTPPPAPGEKDLWGVELSPVASAGDTAPPVPEGSGAGRRVVYDRAGQRVWAVAENGRIIRSWLVSGSKFTNEQPGTHTVYSRSEMSTAWNGNAYLPKMIRYQRTEIGHIGFHSIPLDVETGAPYQTTDELGTRLSGGCQRQHWIDAEFLWGFATEGTTVVVI